MRIHGKNGRVKASHQHLVFPALSIRMVPKVEKLLRVFFQVVEFPLIGPVINHDLFPIRTQHRPIGVTMRPCVVVFRKNLLVNILGFALTLEHGKQALALHASGNFQSGCVQEGRSKVDQLDHAADPTPRLDSAAGPNDQRHAHLTVVKMRALEVDPVIPEHFPMVGHEDHQGILGLPGFVKSLENPTDLLVDQGDHGHVRGVNLPAVVIAHRAGLKFPGLIVSPFAVQLLKGRLLIASFG